MKKAIIFIVCILIVSVGSCEQQFMNNDYEEVTLTDDMLQCISDMCYNKIYTVYFSREEPKSMGISFRNIKPTNDLIKKLFDYVIISKLYPYKVYKHKTNETYKIYVDNMGIKLHNTDMKSLWENGLLLKKDGLKKYIEESSYYIPEYKEMEYMDYVYIDEFIFELKKEKSGYICINYDGYEHNDKSDIKNTEQFKLYESIPYEYVEHFRQLMADIIEGKQEVDNSIIFKEFTFAQ